MSAPASSTANRLAAETSPYLLQHQDNPVDWHAWSPEALALAKQQNKPILLSIGYAACHWCHVMAHESFENPEIASLMNELFVNIKVDREERPDLDTIYQSALALLGEQGGWPLTMFLTPDAEPFWGGTYFPPAPRFGRPGFPQVLQGISDAYREGDERIVGNVGALRDALAKLSSGAPGQGLSPAVLDQVSQRVVRELDPFHGGIGHAPKFPQPSILKQLWRAWKRTAADPYRHAVLLTLTKMSQGGIYDHLGGGFARYSVDERWLVPHFEKMLYDNAQLIDVLTWAWQDTGDPLYAARVRETVDWLQREMIALDGPDGTATGAFASTLDADSEGVEGKFYVWDEAEIDDLLGDDAALFKEIYDVTPGGNFEGHTILNRSAHPEPLDAESETRLAMARKQLFAAREPRIRPGWDDKVLADWNGLMIAALARAAGPFQEPAWLELARTAFRFVCDRMQVDGRLQHAWRHGRLKHPATADDYANMADAALALFEATGEADYLSRAEAWVEVMQQHYWDAEAGGYFLTADDTEALIVRTKTANDNAVPAANGSMVGVLARLFYLTGRSDYRDRADRVLAGFSGDIERTFFALSTMLNGFDLLTDALQVVVIGDPNTEDTQRLRATLDAASLPNRVTLLLSPGAESQLPRPTRRTARPRWTARRPSMSVAARPAPCRSPTATRCPPRSRRAPFDPVAADPATPNDLPDHEGVFAWVS